MPLDVYLYLTLKPVMGRCIHAKVMECVALLHFLEEVFERIR